MFFHINRQKLIIIYSIVYCMDLLHKSINPPIDGHLIQFYYGNTVHISFHIFQLFLRINLQKENYRIKGLTPSQVFDIHTKMFSRKVVRMSSYINNVNTHLLMLLPILDIAILLQFCLSHFNLHSAHYECCCVFVTFNQYLLFLN